MGFRIEQKVSIALHQHNEWKIENKWVTETIIDGVDPTRDGVWASSFSADQRTTRGNLYPKCWVFEDDEKAAAYIASRLENKAKQLLAEAELWRKGMVNA